MEPDESPAEAAPFSSILTDKLSLLPDFASVAVAVSPVEPSFRLSEMFSELPLEADELDEALDEALDDSLKFSLKLAVADSLFSV